MALDLKEVFDRLNDDFLKFDRVKNKLHARPDLCAFLLLDQLLPNPGHDMVCSASHDEIWIDVDIEKLAEIATEADVLTLLRCGVRLDSETDSLALFV